MYVRSGSAPACPGLTMLLMMTMLARIREMLGIQFGSDTVLEMLMMYYLFSSSIESGVAWRSAQ